MKKLIVSLGLVVVMLLGASYYIWAQEQSTDPGHGWMHGQKQWGDLCKRLNLTPDQKAKFQELRQKFLRENAQLIGGIVTKRLELKSLWSDPKVDSQAILAKEKELVDLQNQMRDKVIHSLLEARNSLTPEQIEKIGMMGWGRHGFHRRLD